METKIILYCGIFFILISSLILKLKTNIFYKKFNIKNNIYYLLKNLKGNLFLKRIERRIKKNSLFISFHKYYLKVNSIRIVLEDDYFIRVRSNQ